MDPLVLLSTSLRELHFLSLPILGPTTSTVAYTTPNNTTCISNSFRNVLVNKSSRWSSSSRAPVESGTDARDKSSDSGNLYGLPPLGSLLLLKDKSLLSIDGSNRFVNYLHGSVSHILATKRSQAERKMMSEVMRRLVSSGNLGSMVRDCLSVSGDKDEFPAVERSKIPASSGMNRPSKRTEADGYNLAAQVVRNSIANHFGSDTKVVEDLALDFIRFADGGHLKEKIRKLENGHRNGTTRADEEDALLRMRRSLQSITPHSLSESIYVVSGGRMEDSRVLGVGEYLFSRALKIGRATRKPGEGSGEKGKKEYLIVMHWNPLAPTVNEITVENTTVDTSAKNATTNASQPPLQLHETVLSHSIGELLSAKSVNLVITTFLVPTVLYSAFQRRGIVVCQCVEDNEAQGFADAFTQGCFIQDAFELAEVDRCRVSYTGFEEVSAGDWREGAKAQKYTILKGVGRDYGDCGNTTLGGGERPQLLETIAPETTAQETTPQLLIRSWSDGKGEQIKLSIIRAIRSVQYWLCCGSKIGDDDEFGEMVGGYFSPEISLVRLFRKQGEQETEGVRRWCWQVAEKGMEEVVKYARFGGCRRETTIGTTGPSSSSSSSSSSNRFALTAPLQPKNIAVDLVVSFVDTLSSILRVDGILRIERNTESRRGFVERTGRRGLVGDDDDEDDDNDVVSVDIE